MGVQADASAEAPAIRARSEAGGVAVAVQISRATKMVDVVVPKSSSDALCAWIALNLCEDDAAVHANAIERALRRLLPVNGIQAG